MKQSRKARKLAKLDAKIARIDKQSDKVQQAFEDVIKNCGEFSQLARTAAIKQAYAQQLLAAKRTQYVSEKELIK